MKPDASIVSVSYEPVSVSYETISNCFFCGGDKLRADIPIHLISKHPKDVWHCLPTYTTGTNSLVAIAFFPPAHLYIFLENPYSHVDILRSPKYPCKKRPAFPLWNTYPTFNAFTYLYHFGRHATSIPCNLPSCARENSLCFRRHRRNAEYVNSHTAEEGEILSLGRFKPPL